MALNVCDYYVHLNVCDYMAHGW